MINLLRAEGKKSLGNYRLTLFLVWVYPVGIAAFYGFLIVGTLLSETLRAGIPLGSGSWIQDMVSGWAFINSFPGNVFGRLFPLAYMALVFAGEYEWGTWKNIIPRNRRAALLVSKLAVITLLVMLSLVLMSLLIPIGQGALHRIVGEPYGPALDLEGVREFGQIYIREAALGGATLVILATFAALAAVITRSTLGTLLLCFGFSVLDLLMAGFLLLIGNILGRPGLVNLYQYSMTYNLDNIRSWLLLSAPLRQPVSGFTAEPALLSSILILGLWILLLLCVTLIVFQKQDITS
jgi:ABC-type transport system involved in multi-copper enzyme maturation permease subunit